MPEEEKYTRYLKEDLKHLMECDAIYMLKGWGKSNGANIEYINAIWLGLEVLHESKP